MVRIHLYYFPPLRCLMKSLRHHLFIWVILGLAASVLSHAQPEPEKPYDSVVLKTGQRQLFLDDFVLGDLFGVTRVIHPPAKYAGNPVIRPDRPSDGLVIQMRDGPSWDEQEKVWKVWYNRKGHFGNGWGSGFARSKDGITWEKPDLGLVQIDGNRLNNVVLVKDHPQAYLQHVMMDPTAAPDRRYKGMLGTDGRKAVVSADGLTFTVLPVPPIPSQDESHLTWDDLQQQYLLTVKHNGPFGRAVYLSVSRDYEQWTPPTLIYNADAHDQTLAESFLHKIAANERMYRPPINHPREYIAEIYNMPIFTYEGIYIGLPTYFESSGRIPPPAGNQDGISSVKLVTSRDLRTWTRVGDRRHFIPISEMAPGVSDTGQILAASHPIRMGDELWFYYSGLNVRYRPKPADEPEPYFPYRGGICLAKLRLDGFASLHADESGGFVETRPIRFDGHRLFINGEAAKGNIRAEVTDAAGRVVLEGWDTDQSEIVTGDQLRAELRWKGHDLQELHGKRVRLRFHLKNADLYSFWFE